MPQELTPKGYFRFAGTRRLHHPEDRILEPCDPALMIQITLRLRSRNPGELEKTIAKFSGRAVGRPPHLNPSDYEEKFGASIEDIQTLKDFAAEENLTVVQTSAVRRSVILSGNAANLNNAFKVRLVGCEHKGQRYHTHDGDIYLPEVLRHIVTRVFGLDNRPQAHPHFRRLVDGAKPAQAAAAADRSFDPTQIAELYHFPSNVSGAGETVGFIELGGGYKQSDLTTYFKKIGISPMPVVTSVSVDQASNAPTGDPNSADGEVALDIEITGAVAPGAKIKVFFAPNTDQGFLDAITTAVHDSETTLISISWGQAEAGFSDQSRAAFDEAFQAAAALGKTVFAASGDNGSTDGSSDGTDNVDFPASSPFAVGCGGTTLSASVDATLILSETVWNEESRSLGSTGGGVSNFFELPEYQRSIGVPPSQNSKGGRGVPDVAGDADPASGYNVLVDGSNSVSGGTSAVAPLLAGLFALINEALRDKGLARAGFIHPTIYAHPEVFNDITVGNNGSYQAGPGWDATTGLGSPDGSKLLDLFLDAKIEAIG